MSKMIYASVVAVMVAVAASAGCVDARDEHEPDKTGAAVQAISGLRTRILYYSDDTYSTQTGHYFSNCYGQPNIAGTGTEYITGFMEACDQSYITGCLQFYDDVGYVCPTEYFECVYCQ